MDNLTKKEQPDRSKINMHEPFEVKYWTHALGVSKEELQKAVDKKILQPLCVSAGVSRQLSLMIDPKCPVCFGSGWVCENHPHRAWDEKFGCQCGAGMPCACQRANGLEQPDVSGVLDETPPSKH